MAGRYFLFFSLCVLGGWVAYGYDNRSNGDPGDGARLRQAAADSEMGGGDLSIEGCIRRFGNPLGDTELKDTGLQTLFESDRFRDEGYDLILYAAHDPETRAFQTMTLIFYPANGDGNEKRVSVPPALLNRAVQFVSGVPAVDLGKASARGSAGGGKVHYLSEELYMLLGQGVNGEPMYIVVNSALLK